MKKFKHSDNEEFGRRSRKERKPRGGAKNYTQSFAHTYEKEESDITNNDLSDFQDQNI
jgi:hypothetical protein